MPPRNPYRIPLFVIAAGAGLALYYGHQLREMPAIPEAELDARVEQRIASIMERRGPHLSGIEGERLRQMRAEAREQIRTSALEPRREAQYRSVAGIAVVIIGFGNLLLIWLIRRRRES